MVHRLPSRRLLQSSSLQCIHHQHQHTTFLASSPSIRPVLPSSHRLASSDNSPNSILIDNLQRRDRREAAGGGRPDIVRGDLARSSIFDSERAVQERENAEAKSGGASSLAPRARSQPKGPQRNLANMSAVLDPRPAARERWQRKMVIREVKKGGRLTREQFIRKTERESSVKSPNFKTSVKKLGPLARQITGKSIEEAIVQMRFSKKKVAQDVREHLEYARDRAIVERGMGLGQGGKPREDANAGKVDSSVSLGEEGEEADTVEGRRKKKVEGTEIQLKDGKRYTVTDPTQIYIDQAWVGRGPYGQLPDYRARGRVFVMRTPWTHFTVKLKEEVTRVREWQDREQKRQRKRVDNLWVPLPDRPVTAQRQWYCW